VIEGHQDDDGAAQCVDGLDAGLTGGISHG
jgi:hypothetical protein